VRISKDLSNIFAIILDIAFNILLLIAIMNYSTIAVVYVVIILCYHLAQNLTRLNQSIKA